MSFPPAAAITSSDATPDRRERVAVLAILLLSGVIQFHAVSHDGAMGQDFTHNYTVCTLISRHLSLAWQLAGTNPPGFHYMAAFIIRAVGVVNGVAAVGLVNLGFSVAALAALYWLSLRLIARPVWRVGLLVLVAFVPVRLIHGVVIASDALTLLPFFLLAGLLCRLTDETAISRRRWLAAGIALLLTAGMFIKYTFMSSVVAVVLVLAQSVRRRRFDAWEAAKLGALCVALPMVALCAQTWTQENFQGNFGMGAGLAHNMTYASVFGLHAADPHLLDAPRYFEPNRRPGEVPANYIPSLDDDNRYEMLIPNRYSYPALLHWSVFTDPLDIFQPRRPGGTFGERSAGSQRLMTLAVRTAVPLTLVGVAAMLFLSFTAGVGGLLAPTRVRADVEAVWLLGMGWFGNIALLMPHVHLAYLGGYWTPRLVLPGLLTFAVLTFHVLDRRLPGRAGEIVGGVVLGYVVLQSALQAAFLWV